MVGAVMGIAMGFVAGTYLASERGKKFKSKVHEIMEDFREHIGPKIKDLAEMTKEEYDAFMDSAVEQYAKAKNMSVDLIDKLKNKVRRSRDYFLEYLE